MNTKFTIIIPTRERADTLQATLRTCLNQNYDNYEIIVSDNFSQDDTAKVVASFNSERVRYINTGQRLSMTHNWEFALSHVLGGYVTFIGDDDGFLPDVLSEIDEIIQKTATPVLTWQTARYFWPKYSETAKRNVLTIDWRFGLEKYVSRERLAAAARFELFYHDLPCIYNSFVRYDLLEAVKKGSDGETFFHSRIPDVYSAIVLAAKTPTYYFSRKPFTLSGVSHHSTGMSQQNPHNNGVPAEKFLSENNLPFHPALVQAPSIFVLQAEPFLQAREHFAGFRELNINIEITRLIDAIAVQLVFQPPFTYSQLVAALQEIGRLNNLEIYVEQVISNHPPIPNFYQLYPAFGFNILSRQLYLDASTYGVKDIYDACLLTKSIISNKQKGFMRLSLNGIIKTTFASGLRKARRKYEMDIKKRLSKFVRPENKRPDR
jgi:glycosyltransferase involved in cell wall biosynthesis